jgi:hypothetical protein
VFMLVDIEAEAVRIIKDLESADHQTDDSDSDLGSDIDTMCVDADSGTESI